MTIEEHPFQGHGTACTECGYTRAATYNQPRLIHPQWEPGGCIWAPEQSFGYRHTCPEHPLPFKNWPWWKKIATILGLPTGQIPTRHARTRDTQNTPKTPGHTNP